MAQLSSCSPRAPAPTALPGPHWRQSQPHPTQQILCRRALERLKSSRGPVGRAGRGVAALPTHLAAGGQGGLSQLWPGGGDAGSVAPGPTWAGHVGPRVKLLPGLPPPWRPGHSHGAPLLSAHRRASEQAGHPITHSHTLGMPLLLMPAQELPFPSLSWLGPSPPWLALLTGCTPGLRRHQAFPERQVTWPETRQSRNRHCTHSTPPPAPEPRLTAAPQAGRTPMPGQCLGPSPHAPTWRQSLFQLPLAQRGQN